MCGPTAEQTTVQQEDIATMEQYNRQQAEQYANQKALYAMVKSVLDPIIKAGPGQEGYTAEEKNNLNAQAVTGTANNYAMAARAVNEQLAAQGGGNSPITTGGQAQMKQEVANSAAALESEQESQIIESNYAIGRQNFQNAESGELAIAAGENPIGYAQAATSQSKVAGDEANAIAEQENSWVNAVIGAAGAIGAGAATGFCPADGSMMRMADGTQKAIEKLEIGERICGIDGAALTIEEIQTGECPILLISLANRLTARVSPSHAFALPMGGFTVAAKSLGQIVQTSEGPARVYAVSPGGYARVHNVITDGSHTYCADGIWALGVGDAERHIDMKTWMKTAAEMAR